MIVYRNHVLSFASKHAIQTCYSYSFFIQHLEILLGFETEYLSYLTAKSARLRQAKEEAEREIAEYRAQMEAEFQRKVAEVCIFQSCIVRGIRRAIAANLPVSFQSSGDSGANVKRLEQETDTKIAQLKEQAANVSPEVIQMLLRHVTTVKN